MSPVNAASAAKNSLFPIKLRVLVNVGTNIIYVRREPICVVSFSNETVESVRYADSIPTFSRKKADRY